MSMREEAIDAQTALRTLEDCKGALDVQAAMDSFAADAIYIRGAEPEYPAAETEFERENPLDALAGDLPVSDVQVDVPHETIAYRTHDGMQYLIASFAGDYGFIADSNDFEWLYGEGQVWLEEDGGYERTDNAHISCPFPYLTGSVWEDASEVYEMDRQERETGDELTIVRSTWNPSPEYYAEELEELRENGRIDMGVERPGIPSDARNRVGPNRASNLAKAARKDGLDVSVKGTSVRINDS